MKIQVLYFAALKDHMGRSEEIVDAEPGSTPATLARLLLGLDSNLLYAVNDELAASDYPLSENDLLAFIPPMAGG